MAGYVLWNLPLGLKILLVIGFPFGIYTYFKKGVRFLSSKKEELKKLDNET